MKKVIQILFGTLVMLAGIATIAFGTSLLFEQQSWIMAGGFLFFFALGFSLTRLGLAILKGEGSREALASVLFIGRRAP
jgi:hypothetical protein